MRHKSVEQLRAECPNRDQHTDGPRDYLAWHEWAEEMGKTHKQKRCPGCRLFMIWEPKEKAIVSGQ